MQSLLKLQQTKVYIINMSLLLFYDQSAFDVYSLHVFMYIHDVC